MENSKKKGKGGLGLSLPMKVKSGFPTFRPFFLAEARNLPPLTEAQKNKLRHLSVVTLAAKVKVSDSPPSPEPKSILLSVPLQGHLLFDHTVAAFCLPTPCLQGLYLTGITHSLHS